MLCYPSRFFQVVLYTRFVQSQFSQLLLSSPYVFIVPCLLQVSTSTAGFGLTLYNPLLNPVLHLAEGEIFDYQQMA